MKLSLVLTVTAVLALLYGLAFLLVPVQLMSFYGVTLDGHGPWIARYLGSAFIGLAVLNWLARTVSDPAALRVIVTTGLVTSVLGLVVGVLDALFGTSNSLIWSTVVIYAALTLGFGYFQFARPVEALAA